MSTESTCATDDCPTVGVDGKPLERYRRVTTSEAEMLVYDREVDAAWIQSDLYVRLDTCV